MASSKKSIPVPTSADPAEWDRFLRSEGLSAGRGSRTGGVPVGDSAEVLAMAADAQSRADYDEDRRHADNLDRRIRRAES